MKNTYKNHLRKFLIIKYVAGNIEHIYFKHNLKFFWIIFVHDIEVDFIIEN